MNEPFINEFAIEINQYPRFNVGIDDVFTIKDYFLFNSKNMTYGHRDTVIPVSFIINKQELPKETVIRELINSRVPVIRRVIDLTTNKESWVYYPIQLGEN
jgi:hypothetical protein